MAEGLNKVMLLGNLGQDPELKTIAGGQAVLNLRLATTETYLDRNNTRQERTDWHTVVIWGKRAEALSKFLTKGACYEQPPLRPEIHHAGQRVHPGHSR